MTMDEADEQLAKAIRDHALAYEVTTSDEFLSDFAVVAYWQTIEDQGDSRYTTHYSRPTMPDHSARGLFATAVRLIDLTE